MTLLVLLSLASYRLWRLLARDEALDPVRDRLLKRWGESRWSNAWTCSWCLGSIVTFALVAGYAQVRSLELPAFWALGAATVVGLIGGRLDA